MTVWDALAPSRVLEGLAASVAAGAVAHAWLLLGPSGAGKESTAIALAAALNCEILPGVGCGSCSTCVRISRRRHPDVHHIVPEGPLIPVDVIRESVVPEAARSPFEGAWKVFIIEEADRMNEPAQNALLKTLEEPQPDTVFILVSDHEEDILETVSSRSRIVRLEAVPEAGVVALLRRDGAPGDTALLAARLAEGDYERARLLAFDQAAQERRRLWMVIPQSLGSPTEALDLAAGVIAEARSAVAAYEAIHKAEVVELAEAMGEARGTAGARNALARRHRRELRRVELEVIAEALQSIGSFYRDVLGVRAGAPEAVTNLDRLDELDRWGASDLPDAKLLRAVERCIEASGSLPKNANPLLQVEAALVQLAHLVPSPAPPAGIAAGQRRS